MTAAPARDHSHERGPAAAPERCAACHLPAVGWVNGRQWIPLCSVCMWARSRRGPAAVYRRRKR